MTLEQIAAEIDEGWRKVRIQQILHMMRINSITLEDISKTEYIDDMVSTTQTPILPASGYKVAGE